MTVGAVLVRGLPAGPMTFAFEVGALDVPGGHRLRLQGGTPGRVPTRVGLLDPGGQILAEATAAPIAALGTEPLCRVASGAARADLTVPVDVLQDFERSPPRYRLEAEVGGVWRATALDFAGCASIE